jgi:hypothetical protein
MKHCCPTGRRNHRRPLKRLLDTWDRNWSTSGPTAWQIYDDDDDDDNDDMHMDTVIFIQVMLYNYKTMYQLHGVQCMAFAHYSLARYIR